jgi:2-polyprenyl-3-methyl-5-hydroxy-6-metoxy-1,4-benzoquinol methylase
MSLARVQSTYEMLARIDPLWAVLTFKRYKHNRWDPDAFFETGRKEIREFWDYLDRLGLKLIRGRALDFGCAVGRLTQPLADDFAHVVGVDIAESFLDLARQFNRHGERCQYIHNTRGDLEIFESDSFDFIYSNITLQHIPKIHSTKYIAEFFRLLRAGGIAVFHLPSGLKEFDRTLEWCLRWLRWTALSPLKRWWQKLRCQPVIEMHPVSRKEVEAIIAANRARLIDVVENNASGKGWVSLQYCALKTRE